MSIRAIDWALRQDIKLPTDKFVLVILANYVGDTGLAFPATQTISRITGLSRISVVRALDRLVQQRWIEDTGKRTGTTKQIKAYRLRAAIESGKGITETPLKGITESPKGITEIHQRVSQRYTEPLEELLKEPKKNQLSTFIDFLIEDSRFDGLDVEGEVERALEWCKKKNRAVTERFLENWLLHAEPPLEEDEEEVGSLASEPYYSWAGWTEERRRALRELWPGVVEPPTRWDKVSADIKEMIDARVKEGWS
jgi:predicted transcriptional regulator